MANFEFDGEKYRKASKHQKEWGNSLISQMQLKGNESVLDLGCGDGILTEQIALHWIKDHALLLKHSFEALKSGGSIYWNFAGYGTCRTFNAIMGEMMERPEYREFFKNFEWPWFMPSKAEYDSLAGTIGFCDVKIIEENKDRYFADVDEMVRWIDQPSIVPFLQNVPDEAKEDFRREVIQNMIERTKQSDGTCFETFRRINFYARKS